jgi:hypothetical protein
VFQYKLKLLRARGIQPDLRSRWNFFYIEILMSWIDSSHKKLQLHITKWNEKSPKLKFCQKRQKRTSQPNLRYEGVMQSSCDVLMKCAPHRDLSATKIRIQISSFLTKLWPKNRRNRDPETGSWYIRLTELGGPPTGAATSGTPKGVRSAKLSNVGPG